MDAMQIQDVDYYGDSYGTLSVRCSQRVTRAGCAASFSTAHILCVRRIRGSRPIGSLARQGLDLVCDRSPSCRALRGRRPTGSSGCCANCASTRSAAPRRMRTVHQQTSLVDVSTLFLLDHESRQLADHLSRLDAATRAMVRQSHMSCRCCGSLPNTTRRLSVTPVDFSYGQYQAVICGEYPLLYDLNDSPCEAARAVRRGPSKTRVRTDPICLRPSRSMKRSTRMPTSRRSDTCLDWPKPLARISAGRSAARASRSFRRCRRWCCPATWTR